VLHIRSALFHYCAVLCACGNDNLSILLAFLVKFVANLDHDRVQLEIISCLIFSVPVGLIVSQGRRSFSPTSLVQYIGLPGGSSSAGEFFQRTDPKGRVTEVQQRRKGASLWTRYGRPA